MKLGLLKKLKKGSIEFEMLHKELAIELYYYLFLFFFFSSKIELNNIKEKIISLICCIKWN